MTCAKFVPRPPTPRLRQRHTTELALASDVAEHGWTREVERHTATARRIACLLNDLDGGDLGPGPPAFPIN